jgi:uracil-DNA glycosylase family 4
VTRAEERRGRSGPGPTSRAAGLAARGRALESLAREIAGCERCPRLRAWCRKVALEKRRAFRDETYWGRPVPGFGDPRARLLVVGLAPAAHGGNRTGRVFTGDSSGDWLYEALHRFGFANQAESVARDDGLRLRGAYVTASGRCAPPANRPAPAELERCRPFLERELALLAEVRVVVLLGRIAWERWLRAAGWWERLPARERPRFAHGAESVLPDGMRVICSYHPSRQNTHTGRLTRAMWHAVFRRARAIADAPGGAPGRQK